MPTKRGGGWLEEGANGRRAQYRREVSWSCCHHMARARQIKMKFAALTLHLEGMDEIQRAAQSSEHADSMVALIGTAALNGMEKDDVLNSILVAPNRNAWVASDLSRLVAAVEAHRPKRRRDSQVYLLPSEWDKWKANGVQGGENTATTTRTRCTTTRRPPRLHFRTRTWSSADMSRFPMAVFRPKKHTHWRKNGLRKR